MKVVILAGGFGTRISEESHLRPKPMVEIGDNPMLWHIMKYYSSYGFHEFILCCGYKGYVIKEYFADYYLHRSDVTFDFSQGNHMVVHSNVAEAWKVTLVDTGLHTMTGGRIKRVRGYIGDEAFLMTYGDGVSDVDLERLVAYHKGHGRYATVTAVQPQGRFGALEMGDSDFVDRFSEKAEQGGGWINAGFMVLEPQVMDYIDGDGTFFEREPLERLAHDRQLVAYRHDGFWKCMDTLRDKEELERLWASGEAKWKRW